MSAPVLRFPRAVVEAPPPPRPAAEQQLEVLVDAVRALRDELADAVTDLAATDLANAVDRQAIRPKLRVLLADVDVRLARLRAFVAVLG
jgi:hypothetical protein